MRRFNIQVDNEKAILVEESSGDLCKHSDAEQEIEMAQLSHRHHIQSSQYTEQLFREERRALENRLAYNKKVTKQLRAKLNSKSLFGIIKRLLGI